MDKPSNRAQLNAAAYRIPALDADFLLGDSTRGLRFQLEYLKAEDHLRQWGVASTVIVFGSARVSESRVSQLHGQAVARLRARLAAWRDR
ncbi:MAG: hypothetical protein EBU00_06680 [Alphaproteobacteria bacterium]|nr:hypothetical protein [Alphaproteobacteria bacterium]